MKIRAPLVRLLHEIETFNGQAIKDSYNTVQAMERERTEYRAAIAWMKAASAQLDPDKGSTMCLLVNQMCVDVGCSMCSSTMPRS